MVTRYGADVVAFGVADEGEELPRAAPAAPLANHSTKTGQVIFDLTRGEVKNDPGQHSFAAWVVASGEATSIAR